MIRITVKEALRIAEEWFPKAPEKIVELLGIEVRYSPLNCDGWCLQLEDRAIIRINKDVPDVRRRFTLAHELGHLILGVPTIIGESIFDNASRKSGEEKKVDRLAAELLLPKSVVINQIKEVPVTAAVIRRVAKKAKVSDLAVALRVAALSSDLGLSNPSVIFYVNDEITWQWSETLQIPKESAQELLSKCTSTASTAVRIPHEQGKVIVASLLDNPIFNTKTVFLQLVTELVGHKELHEERIRVLEDYVFQSDDTFRQSLNGRFGSFKTKAESMFLDEAVTNFIRRVEAYPGTLEKEHTKRLLSEKGREYIRLRLKLWTKS